MSLSSHEKNSICKQFDSFCKIVIDGEIRRYRYEVNRNRRKEILFSELSKKQLQELVTTDEIDIIYESYRIIGFDIAIRNALLSEALKILTAKKRDIILMSYYLQLSDAEIGRLLNLQRSTVKYHRDSSLEKLRQILNTDKNEGDLYYGN